MRKNRSLNYPVLVAILFIGILIGFSIGFIATEIQITPAPTLTTPSKLTFFEAETYLPAVDNEGNGVITSLKVESRHGTGKVLTNIDKLLFWVDTQYSIQIAKSVAENITGVDADEFDLTYTIESEEAGLIGGPSAGASLTVATISVLENKELKKDVMMTGTINPDGTIGQVGSVLEKARAAKDVGATLFLVPPGESEQVFLKPEEKCVKRAGFIFCETTYKQITVNIGEDVGISVIEVETISDALKYFI
jgi:uncharacterized protein